MNCKEATDMILKGERTEILDRHLEQCSDCRAMEEDLRRITECAKMPLPDVPEKLDKAILACAAERTPHRSMGPTLIFRMPLLRAAAAVAVLSACAVLTFSAMKRTDRPAASATATAAAASAVPEETVGNYLFAAAELDADILALSVELDQTESDMQLMASVSTPSWYTGGSYQDL